MMRKITFLMLCVLFWLPNLAAADSIPDVMSDPFGYYSLYSLGNFEAYYISMQGTVGAAGSASLTSGSYATSVDVGKDLTLGNLSVTGNVSVGGNVHVNGSDWGTIVGDLSVAGNELPDRMGVTGTTATGVSTSEMIDHLALSMFFASTSEMIGSWDSSGTTAVSNHMMTFDGTSGVNVFTVTAKELESIGTFIIDAPEDAVVYINVIDEDGNGIRLNSDKWTYTGGVLAGNVLMNVPEADSLTLTGNFRANILAPFASTVFSGGSFAGSIIAGNLDAHNGSVSAGHFTGGGAALEPAPVPEPGTLVLTALGLFAVLAGLAGRKCRGNPLPPSREILVSSV